MSRKRRFPVPSPCRLPISASCPERRHPLRALGGHQILRGLSQLRIAGGLIHGRQRCGRVDLRCVGLWRICLGRVQLRRVQRRRIDLRCIRLRGVNLRRYSAFGASIVGASTLGASTTRGASSLALVAPRSAAPAPGSREPALAGRRLDLRRRGGSFGCSAGACCSGATGGASGATTSVGMIGMTGSPWSPGLARAGATPPVSAVIEITTPDANTATTLRREQVVRGVRMGVSTPLVSDREAGSPPPLQCSHPPDTGNGPAGAAVLLGLVRNGACGGATIRFQQLDRSANECVTAVRSAHTTT